MDYRQFANRFMAIERRLRIEESGTSQVKIARGKTLTVIHSMTLTGADGYTLTIPATGTAVLLTAAQTLTNKTLTTPTIADFTNATHDHTNAAGGGQLALTTAVTGVLPPANGGTGVDNATRTLTINANSGTLAFSGAGFTLTVPKTGTVPVGTGTAGRIAEWVTDANTVQASTLAKTGAGVLTLAAADAYTLTVPATGTAALLGTANTFTAAQTISHTSTGVAYQLVLSNTSTDAAARGGFQMVRGGDAGTGSTRGAALFTTSTLLGFADYETRTMAIYTGESVGSNTARLAVHGNGDVGIGLATTSPSAQLRVDQSSASGAKPTLRLRQADLSEEFIRFDTTVGAGNPINTTALGAYYGRVRVWVEGVGAKWLALYD